MSDRDGVRERRRAQPPDAYELLRTKLALPRPHSSIVSRDILLARLDEGLDHKLTLLSAPAGFGKTTLVSQWLTSLAHSSHKDQPQARHSLGEALTLTRSEGYRRLFLDEGEGWQHCCVPYCSIYEKRHLLLMCEACYSTLPLFKQNRMTLHLPHPPYFLSHLAPRSSASCACSLQAVPILKLPRSW
jgi:hypothetical protein